MSDKVIRHYGMARRSGRYPWGSGGDPYQGHIDFHGHVAELRKKGLSEVEIATGEGMTTTQLRTRLSLAKTEQRNANISQALQLQDKGYSNMEIGRRMGLNESSVRSLLNPILAERASITSKTADVLRDSVDKQRFVDVGTGVEIYLGVTRNRLNMAVAKLQEEGYQVHRVNVDQLGMPGQFTIVKALGAPDTTWRELVKDPSQVKPVVAYSEDFGRSFKSNLGIGPVQNVKSKRIQVAYKEDGGADKDGVIELRRGVSDLDLGQSKYAQVRIAVDGTHFLKGMAMYKDDMPAGKDIVFNTNKGRETPMLGSEDHSVLKLMKSDPDNPFGSTIKPDGQRGALNIVNEEGDWDKWSRTLSSQMLSKQSGPLAKKQLGIDLKKRQSDFDEIAALTNPAVKRKLMAAYADECDSASVHLKAAALPRQAAKVILPVLGLKSTEVYAPSFKDGEKVVLIRHPHGGTFEIPELTVNNRSRNAKSVMANAKDAVGIHPDVAKRLSGADFDGDHVVVIPNNHGLVKSTPGLKGLENFDPIEIYRIPAGSSVKPIGKRTKQTKMGEVSNLITDMTIKGATVSEITRAVKHSMVVIDSEKHNLDYRQSYIDQGIAALSARYQTGKRGGASTLVSRASSEIRVPERKTRTMAEGGPIDKRTGEKVFVSTGRLTRTKDGQLIGKSTKTTRMAEEKDARALSSGRPIEEVYASYANTLKALGNTARKSTLSIKSSKYSPSANKTYSAEVSTLKAKLNIALKNKPLERQAQTLANSIVARKRQENPNMSAEELKRLKSQALVEARTRTGAKKELIKLTDKEWAAIQAGAVTNHTLTQILDNTDLDRVKQFATPYTTKALSTAQARKADVLLKKGATQAEVADALGVSTRTLYEYLNTGS